MHTKLKIKSYWEKETLLAPEPEGPDTRACLRHQVHLEYFLLSRLRVDSPRCPLNC